MTNREQATEVKTVLTQAADLPREEQLDKFVGVVVQQYGETLKLLADE